MRSIAASSVMAAALLAESVSAQAEIISRPWGRYDGQKVDLYTLTNTNGVAVQITNYGGVVVSIRVPGRDGTFADVVEGFDSLADYTSPDYLERNAHYGALLGRFADRIKDETYAIDGVTYHRTQNGKEYYKRVWTARAVNSPEPQLILKLDDRDGTMGFPGTLKVAVVYTLTENNVLRLDYRATTDKDTVANLTNHSYFNLAGGGTVLDELLTINANAITPGDAKNTPTGEVRPVAGTAFDFRTPTPIGRHIDDPDPLLKQQLGYGVNFVLNGLPGTLRLAARLEDTKSGRVLEEWTTQPDLRLYSANYEPPKIALAKGYLRRDAVALESEHASNSPDIPSFTSPAVTPERPLHEETEFRFLVDKKSPHIR